MDLMKKAYKCIVLLVISFIGGAVPQLVDYYMIFYFNLMLMPTTESIYLVCFLWGIFTHLVIYFVAKKIKVFPVKKYRVMKIIIFFTISTFIYLVSWLFIFGLLFLKGM